VSLLAGKANVADSRCARGVAFMHFVSCNFREDVNITNQVLPGKPAVS
jgi:hypothetical protein